MNAAAGRPPATKLAIDIGGTFTDVVFCDRQGHWRTAKVPTTPQRITEGILAGTDAVGADADGIDVFVHGTTIALNALLEGKTPRVGLITAEGFRDVLEIMRTNRAHMYDLMQDKPSPLVPRRWRVEVSARMGHDGVPLRDVDPDEIARVAQFFREAEIRSVAVCLLHSYANPAHEREIQELLAAALPGVELTLSSALTREWREYERTSTTVINAAAMPIMKRYLSDLETELTGRRFTGRLMIMQSNGGVTTAADARERPVMSLMSGPAGAVAGAAELARRLGTSANLVTIDIGGTSADVAVIDRGEPTARTLGQVRGWPVMVPSLDIDSIGAGGGSIARVDPFGGLSVGPESAGAFPGPACYGLGGVDPTVTDAHLVLGRLNPDQVLGGRVTLDADPARHAIEDGVARHYDMTLEQAAEGVITVANSNMTRLLWEMVIGRGRDPRDFVLVALGGGGGLHVWELAQALGIQRAIVPPEPGAFSAFGMLSADIRHDFSQTLVLTGQDDPAEVDAAFAILEQLAAERLAHQRTDDEQVDVRRVMELRYEGQRAGLQVEIDDRLRGLEAVNAARDSFELEHERLFGFRRSGRPVEIVRLQLSLVAKLSGTAPQGGPEGSTEGGRSRRRVYGGGEYHDATVISRALLAQSETLRGPCVVEESTATTYVPPGCDCRVDEHGNLELLVGRPGISA